MLAAAGNNFPGMTLERERRAGMVPVLRPSGSALTELLLSLGGAGDRGSSPSPGKREMSPVMQQGRSGEAQAALMEQILLGADPTRAGCGSHWELPAGIYQV